jgi:hypothetical protein
VVLEQCSRRYALSVERRLKFLSNRHRGDPSIVGIATRSIEGTRGTRVRLTGRAIFPILSNISWILLMNRAHLSRSCCNERVLLAGYDANL